MKYGKGSFITVPHRTSILGIGAGPQALYMWLCSYANTEGECFPSRKTLAESIGCSERAIDSYLEDLVSRGLLKKESRFLENKQLSNNYFIPIGVQNLPQGVAKSAPTPSQILRTELNPVLTQSIEEGAERDYEREDRTTTRVIPTPYSVASTREAWVNGELRLQVLNWYFTEANLWDKATTKVRLQVLMKRHSNAASRIARAEWSPRELREAKRKIMANDKLAEEWTLETIEKYLTK